MTEAPDSIGFRCPACRHLYIYKGLRANLPKSHAMAYVYVERMYHLTACYSVLLHQKAGLKPLLPPEQAP